MILENKTIVVIGGTSGIGAAAVAGFLNEGAKVVNVGLPGDREVDHQNLITIHKDVREENYAKEVFLKAKGHFGRIHGLYHVAGGSGRQYGDGPLHEMTTNGWEETFNLNLTSMMKSNRAAVQHFMESNEGGSILNLSSVLGAHPSPEFFTTHAYAAAKGAVEGFVKSTAAYYAKYNIRINALAPGLVETPMSKRASQDDRIMNFVRSKQPLDGGRNGSTNDLVGAALYFMSDWSKFTTGQLLKVDGGWSVTEGKY